jgi:uncharacterized protein YgbK (DUF1537 family)
LFSIGSSGIETALAASFNARSRREEAETATGVNQSLLKPKATTALVGSGSCSPVTAGQIAWAVNHGFAEMPLNAFKLAVAKTAAGEIHRAADGAARMLKAGRSVIVHTARGGADTRIARKLKHDTAQIIGTALGKVLRDALEKCPVSRICLAGGDSSSFAARVLGIEALEMIAPLTPGAPLCRAYAPGSPVDGCEMVFKGGQVGAKNYFEIIRRGRT